MDMAMTKDSVNLFRTVHLILAPVGHSIKLPRQTTTNTLATPSRDCYFQQIAKEGQRKVPHHISINVHTLNTMMKAWKETKKTQGQ